MGYLKYVKKAFQQPTKEGEQILRQRLIQYRHEQSTVRVERPTRIDRARSLGYRAKPGLLIIRQRVLRGGHVRPDIKSGRRPSRFHQTKNLNKNYQRIAEERAVSNYRNCEVLGSYYLAKDGQHYWYEVILVDRRHPQVLADTTLIGIAAQRGRAHRGITSAGQISRGLRSKGKGAEKIRPSRRANDRLH